MSHEKSFRAKGFTLVELIIVIALIAILSLIGVAAFSSYSRAQALNAAKGGLATTLNLAKSRAYSQVKPDICGNNLLDGYEVRICSGSSCTGTPIGTSYALYVWCGATQSPITPVSLSNLTLSSTSNPAVYSFFFPVLKGGVAGNGVIRITNDFNEFKNITVDPSGNIK